MSVTSVFTKLNEQNGQRHKFNQIIMSSNQWPEPVLDISQVKLLQGI